MEQTRRCNVRPGMFFFKCILNQLFDVRKITRSKVAYLGNFYPIQNGYLLLQGWRIMDSTKLKEIFDGKDEYKLPIRWDGKDFYATLYKHLKKYREDIEKHCDNADLRAKVKAVCRGLCAAVDSSLRGYPEKAYKSFEGVMEILNKDPLLINEEDVNKEPLYRVVDVGNAAVPNRQRIFHVPFSMRSEMQTRSIVYRDFPVFILAHRLSCVVWSWAKTQRDYVCASRYELQTDDRVFSCIIGTDQSPPVFDNDEFRIFDVSMKPGKAIDKLCRDDKEIAKYIQWYPLIASCSYIRAMRSAPYSAEYIIPQLFLQWVRSEDEDAVVGIKYFSCVSAYASELGDNYVFPTMGTPYHARKTITDYCARLSHRFKLTVPRFLMDYKPILDCIKEMEEDNNLEYIENYNADEDKKIKDYTIPEGVFAIGAFAFYNCSLLTSITIPDSVTTIGNDAFSRCSSLTSIDIPDSVTTIGNDAFSRCNSLTSITIPDSVTIIGNDAFLGCSSLTNIAVNSSNEYYSSVKGVLYNKNITELICYPAGKSRISFTIPDSVMSIGESAFHDCSKLENTVIPNSVMSIGRIAFSGCSSLTSITIPNSVKSIGKSAFSSCDSLTDIKVNRTNEYYTSVGNVLYNKNMTELICYPAGKSQTSFTVPDSVMSIGESAFYNCRKLENIVISISVMSIGRIAFSGCNSLTSIIIPDSVTSIGGGAFSGCSKLTSITIPDSVTSVSEYAFFSCGSLTNVNIPYSVKSIGKYAFLGCSSLDTVYYSGTQKQAEKLNIGRSNENLQKATWVYGSSGDKS